ncbi:hypothetical protein [Erythrobacter sp. EC-HK427]|uniref:hypothetical protein n=1 Tax=Erythrobacter sp. EC-HK427 TaxID=2038396 RepID=UPI001258C679|nr:hypothetical protein [Erythrobacter sp. EC-HK427]VVS98408.1 hypothetical protein ERY430_40238 [Erythrobacter sp. EC-HK427]
MGAKDRADSGYTQKRKGAQVQIQPVAQKPVAPLNVVQNSHTDAGGGESTQ